MREKTDITVVYDLWPGEVITDSVWFAEQGTRIESCEHHGEVSVMSWSGSGGRVVNRVITSEGRSLVRSGCASTVGYSPLPTDERLAAGG